MASTNSSAIFITLNAEEEPEDGEDYPKDPAFKQHFGPRGVLHAWADGKCAGRRSRMYFGPLTKEADGDHR